MEELTNVMETIDEVVETKNEVSEAVQQVTENVPAELPELPDYSNSPWKGIAIGIAGVGVGVAAGMGIRKAYRFIRGKIADRKMRKQQVHNVVTADEFYAMGGSETVEEDFEEIEEESSKETKKN